MALPLLPLRTPAADPGPDPNLALTLTLVLTLTLGDGGQACGARDWWIWHIHDYPGGLSLPLSLPLRLPVPLPLH